MKSKLHAYMFALGCLAALLTGCGNGGGTPAANNTLHESTACISCHDDPKWVTPGTGKPIVTEWKLSTHMIANGAGCVDCHDDGYMHPASCNKCHSVGTLAKNPTKNPDQDGKCAKCHKLPNPRPGRPDGFHAFSYEDPNIPKLPAGSTTAFIHFSAGKRANFVSTNYINNCRKCHNPHDTASGKPQRQEWAQSGHGATTTNPRTNSDFKTRGTSLPASIAYGDSCVRCHTSTGPINFMTQKVNGNVFQYVDKLPLPSSDRTREVTSCDVCHDNGSGYSYGYAVRTVPAVTTYYNMSTTPKAGPAGHVSISKTYPNINSSNVCLVCHVGREIGDTIKQAKAQGVNFTNVYFMSSHYLTAGASLFQISGYEFSGRDYTGSGAYPHLHRGIGAGASGPCVTCHMKPGRHTFLPLTFDNASSNKWKQRINSIASPQCDLCHNSAVAPPLNTNSLYTSKRGMYAVLTALYKLMNANGMYYARGSISTTASGATKVSNWDKFGAGSGPDTMGAAFNYILITFDYGAYVHNSLYMKRLLYDSIDFLDGGGLNFSTCTTLATNAEAYNYLCTKGTTLNSATERP
jgi:hypothetical protein